MTERKTKVLHLTYDMRIGGTEMVIKNLVEGLDSEQFDVGILNIQANLGPFGEMLKLQGVAIYNLNWTGGFDTGLIKQIRRHIQQHRIDILHCHQYTPWVYGVLAAAFTNTKVIFTEHGRFYPDVSSWKRKLINPVLMGFTDKVTAISHATARALDEYEFIKQNRIQVIYNGIAGLQRDPDAVAQLKQKYGLSQDNIIFGTVARLDPIKNQTMMIRAFNSCLTEHPQIRLFIVGDGDERETLESLVNQLNLTDKVFFTGYEPKPANYIAMMDGFLLSSLSEGTSMTLLEAMSLAKPCIVTDAGGNKEVVEHLKTGWVTQNNDERSFAMGIRAFLNQTEQQAKDMAMNIKERFENTFEQQVMIRDFVQLYTSLKR